MNLQSENTSDLIVYARNIQQLLQFPTHPLLRTFMSLLSWSKQMPAVLDCETFGIREKTRAGKRVAEVSESQAKRG